MDNTTIDCDATCLSTWTPCHWYDCDWVQAQIDQYGPLMGIAVVVIFLLAIWRWIANRNKSLAVGSTELGGINVSHAAFQELVRSICVQAGISERVKVNFTVKRKKLHLTIRVKAPQAHTVHTLASRLQTDLAQALTEHLGIEKLGSIDVLIVGFNPPNNSSYTNEPSSLDSDTHTPFTPSS
jgi:hypothetical protein